MAFSRYIHVHVQCILWILLKMLCSKVLAIFADHHCLQRDSDHRRLVSRSSDSFCNSTDSSLVTASVAA